MNLLIWKLLILYYCLEIWYFWKLYGDGFPDPQIDYDGTFLQHFIIRLTKAGFYFEVLELLEHFVEDSISQIKAMAYSLQADNSFAFTTCLIRLAAVHGKAGDKDDAEILLSLVNQFLRGEHEVAKIQCEMIVNRFLEGSSVMANRIDQLLQLSQRLIDLGDFNTALQALEYAAEVQDTLSLSAQTKENAIRIHSALQAVCERSNDHLSQVLLQFRNCDVLNSITDDLSGAIRGREALFTSPLYAKLPYFQSFHRRQWAEYFMLRQRENALRSTIIYLEYCKAYKSTEEQSLAENMRLQTDLQPARMSDDVRASLLEDVRQQLEQGIKIDKANDLYLPQVEKQLLLVEALDELGKLEEEEPEEIARVAIGILDDAASVCNKIAWKSENDYLKFEILFLRGAASDLSKEISTRTADEPGSLLFGTNIRADSPPSSQAPFPKTRYLQEIIFAIRNDSLSAFQRTIKHVCHYEDGLASNENSVRRAELLNFKGMVYYLLMEFESAAIRKFWEAAGFQSFVEGAKMVLKCFEEAFDLNVKMAQEVMDRNESVDTMTKLAAGQEYFTNASQLLIFDIALELAIGSQDKNRTWDWIQRSKAQALSEMLRRSLGPDYLRNSPDYLAFSKSLKFEDLQYIDTASAKDIVFVDWSSFGVHDRRLLFFSFRMGRDETGPIAEREMVVIDTPIEDLKEAARRITDARMDDADASRYLRPFVPVIQPLATCTKPGDIVLMSLTAPLHAVPLHAVELGSGQLIERNPVSYVPSHAALLSCLQRLAAPEPGVAPTSWKASVFGAYDDNDTDPVKLAERKNIYNGLTRLAGDLGTEPVLGASLTKAKFKQMSAQANLLHFHGHGVFDGTRPEQSSLILGLPTEILGMADIVDLKLNGSHVKLIACSGAIQDFSLSGDEPLGLFSYFLLGGASSVIGPLWPIASSTGRLFARKFYDYFLNHVDRTELGPIVNLAMALRHTMLEVKKHPGCETPYHWAPFVLYGVWFCRRKPGTW